jgi:hypothetical protein
MTAPDRAAIDVLVEALELARHLHNCPDWCEWDHAFNRVGRAERTYDESGPVALALRDFQRTHLHAGPELVGDALLRAAIADCAG